MDAKDRALRYLSMRMCSCRQMERYLREKGYEDDEIEPVIEELKEYKYLDDISFAESYIEAGYEKGRGIARIRRELADRGVSPEIIAFAEEKIEDAPDEFEAAFELAEGFMRHADTDDMDWKQREALKGRIARRLATRGFSTETIYRVIGRLL